MSYPQYPQNGPDGPPGSYPVQPYVGGYGDNEMAPPNRPGTVIAGCIMTWVGGAFGILIGAVLAAVSSQQDFQDQVNLSDDGANTVRTIGVLLLIWSALAIVFGLLSFLGHRWAAIVLAVMAAIYMLVSIYGVASSGQAGGLFGPVYSVAASVLILVGSKSWFTYKARS
ncbi:MAG: hypothetical protein ABJA81_09080 [Nocardioidaceae bacterium]